MDPDVLLAASPGAVVPFVDEEDLPNGWILVTTRNFLLFEGTVEAGTSSGHGDTVSRHRLTCVAQRRGVDLGEGGHGVWCTTRWAYGRGVEDQRPRGRFGAMVAHALAEQGRKEVRASDGVDGESRGKERSEGESPGNGEADGGGMVEGVVKGIRRLGTWIGQASA